MIRNRLFRQYYLFTALIVVVFVFLGSYASRFALRLSAPPQMEGRHSIYLAKLVDQLNPTNRGEGLARLEALGGLAGGTHLSVVDDAGNVVYPPGESLGLDWSKVAKPQQSYENLSLKPFQSLIRFPGNPPQYLYVTSGRGRPRSETVLVTTFASLGVSALIGIALAMLALFKSLRDKAVLADSVIAELQRGNLKARFPIRRMDEIGQAMGRFNKMADEIERLVEQLRSVERSRMALLQELAHDLRTPVASLKNLLETLQSQGGSIAAALHEELLGLALKETDYFERLVEDLLVLAQVSEPRYLASREALNLAELLEEEADGLRARRTSEARKIELVKFLPAAPVLVHGDPQLLRRMIRNTLDNAFSFARHRVVVRLERENGERARIVVEDDGPGFSADALASYGERRVSRVLGTTQEASRLSVGLGSVIIKTVARSQGGEVQAANVTSGSGQAVGASVSIRLPVTAKS